jgi:hypothetical protein
MTTTATAVLSLTAQERKARDADQHEVNVLKKAQDKLAISKAIAQERHIKLPQYKGHWQDTVLVQVQRTVTTKAGTAFVAGDFSHARKDPHSWQIASGARWIVYSHRNGVDTALGQADLQVVGG